MPRKLRVVNCVLAACVLLAIVGAVLVWQLQWRAQRGENTDNVVYPLRLDQSALDSAPGVGLSQLSESDTLTIRGHSYTVNRTDNTACRSAAEGEDLLARLGPEECERVLRVTLLDQEKEWVATFGIAQMSDARTATEVDDLLNTPSQNRFPLLDPDTPGLSHGGRSVKVQHAAVGQYVTFYAVARLDGAKISNTDETMLRILRDVEAHTEEALRVHALTA